MRRSVQSMRQSHHNHMHDVVHVERRALSAIVARCTASCTQLKAKWPMMRSHSGIILTRPEGSRSAARVLLTEESP
jgi:hypothetical protein